VIVNGVSAATGVVETVKVIVVPPAGTVTLVGTCAAVGLLLDKVTTAPPAGAALVRITLPVEVAPPNTEVGVSVMELRIEDVTVKLADWVPL
jgi:hypothetical protein